jgi:hypothetical protein
MANNLLSPGVAVQIIDQTTTTAPIQGTVAAVVGFADKGPVNVPTFVPDLNTFTTTFGNSIPAYPYMAMFASKFLTVSTAYFTRIAHEVEFNSIQGTAAPSLNFVTVSPAAFWVDISGLPILANNGIYRVFWTANVVYSTITALVAAINTAFAATKLADNVTFLSSYLTATTDITNTFIVIESTALNINFTLRQDGWPIASITNVLKTTPPGSLGFADGASTTTNSDILAYALVRVPVSDVAATNASITSPTAISAQNLNKINAFPYIDIAYDGDSTPITLPPSAAPNPPFSNTVVSLSTSLNIVPTNGQQGAFAILGALAAPATFNWTGVPVTGPNIAITLQGFYNFNSTDTTTEVNATFTIFPSISFIAGTTPISQLIIALNAALLATTSGTGGAFTGGSSLQTYIQFSTVNGFLSIGAGTGPLFNLGSQCSVAIADGTGGGLISNLGYNAVSVPPNNIAFGVDATWTLSDVANKINSVAASNRLTIFASASNGFLSISSDRLGYTSFIQILNPSNVVLFPSAVQTVLNFVPTTKAFGVTESDSGVFNFVALTPGTDGNKISVLTYTNVNPVTLVTQYYLQVFYNGVSREVWGPINWTTSTDPQFINTVIKNSAYITVDFGEISQFPNPITNPVPTQAPPNGTYRLTGGNNGIPAGGVISESDTSIADSLAIVAIDAYNNPEVYVIDLALAPGFVSPPVTSALQALGEARQDILCLVDPPAFLSYTDIVNWHNGLLNGSVDLTSKYTVVVWDWQKDFDTFNSEYVNLPPSIYEATIIASTQKGFNLWEAPAGPVRGVINSISSYSQPTQAQRDVLYNDTVPSCVNPIVQFPSQGIMVYGQKTTYRVSSELTRINVVRTVNYVRRNVSAIASNYLFALDQASTWAAITRDLNAFLANVQQRGGIQAFNVIFDNTTNTPNLISQNIMYGKIFIQPTTVAERIYIDLTIQNAGATVTVG